MKNLNAVSVGTLPVLFLMAWEISNADKFEQNMKRTIVPIKITKAEIDSEL